MRNLYTMEEESLAKEEYELLIDSLLSESEFEHEWKGHWEDKEKVLFGGKKKLVKGDKRKFMKYWIQNKDLL